MEPKSQNESINTPSKSKYLKLKLEFLKSIAPVKISDFIKSLTSQINHHSPKFHYLSYPIYHSYTLKNKKKLKKSKTLRTYNQKRIANSNKNSTGTKLKLINELKQKQLHHHIMLVYSILRTESKRKSRRFSYVLLVFAHVH